MEIEFEHRLTEVEARSKSNAHRIDEVENRINDLTALVSTVKVLAEKIGRMETDVTDMRKDVKNLTGKPAKRWDNLINQIITILVAAVAGFILAQIGL